MPIGKCLVRVLLRFIRQNQFRVLPLPPAYMVPTYLHEAWFDRVVSPCVPSRYLVLHPVRDTNNTTSPVWQVGPGFRSTLRLLRCSRLDPPAAFARPAARNATRWLQVQGGVAVCSSPLSSWRCSGTVPTARKIAQAY